MALAAAQVVDALVARLVTVVATAGRVYPSRWHPLPDTLLPCWRVYVADEPVEPAQIDGVNRHLPLIYAEAHATAIADADDVMNSLASAGLSVLFAGAAPYGLQLQGIDRDVSSEGDAASARVRLRLQAMFYAAPSDPETILS